MKIREVFTNPATSLDRPSLVSIVISQIKESVNLREILG